MDKACSVTAKLPIKPKWINCLDSEIKCFRSTALWRFENFTNHLLSSNLWFCLWNCQSHVMLLEEPPWVPKTSFPLCSPPYLCPMWQWAQHIWDLIDNINIMNYLWLPFPTLIPGLDCIFRIAVYPCNVLIVNLKLTSAQSTFESMIV